MLIKNKFNGYSPDGHRVYPCEPSSSGATSQNITQTSIPDYARPYVEEMLGKNAALIAQDYQPYDYNRIADFDPMQLQAQQAAANLGPSKQLGTATQMAGLAGLNAGKTKYDPTTFGNQFTAPDKYSGVNFTNQFTAPTKYSNTQFTYDTISPTDQLGGDMTAAQMTAPSSVTGFGGTTKEASTQSFTDPAATFGGQSTAAKYMNPYTQNVTNIQTREADRAANVANTQLGAQAAQQGAFGGSRHAIMQAEAARNLAQQKGDITAKGQQNAYEQAMQQFNAEQGYGLTAQQANLQAGLQSALANQQTGLTTNTQNLSANQQTNVQNLAAKLQTQGLNAQQAMQAALANQQAGISTQQATEQSKQYGYGQEMTAAQQRAQYGLAAQQAQEQSNQFGYGQQMNAAQQRAQYGLAGQQAGEQSKQFGANLGMQGIQQQLAAAGTLGQLGQTQFGQQKDIINAQANAGAQRQAQQQQKLTQDYNDFQAQKQHPYQQLSYMSDMLRGLPMSQSTQAMYQAPPSAISQFGGAAIAGKYAGLYKKGGIVKASKKSAGLAALALKRMG